MNDDETDDQSDSMSSSETGPLIALSMSSQDESSFEPSFKIDPRNFTGLVIPCSTNGQLKSQPNFSAKQINYKSSFNKPSSKASDFSLAFLPVPDSKFKNAQTITYECQVFTSMSSYGNLQQSDQPSEYIFFTAF